MIVNNKHKIILNIEYIEILGIVVKKLIDQLIVLFL